MSVLLKALSNLRLLPT